MEYIAYLHKDERSDYGVSFPDFPGCITAGSTLEEARKMAADALALHIAGMIEVHVPEDDVVDVGRLDPNLSKLGVDRDIRPRRAHRPAPCWLATCLIAARILT